MKKNIDIVSIAVICFIAYTIFPLFAMFIHLPAWAPSILLSAIILMCRIDLLKSKAFVFFCLYCVILFIFFKLGRTLKVDVGSVSSIKHLIIEYSFIFPNILIAEYLYSKLKDGDVSVVKILFWIFIVSIICYIPIARTYDLRYLARASELGYLEEDASLVIGYTLLHVYPICLPPLLYWTKIASRSYEKVTAWFASLALSYLILKSSVTTIIIVLIIEWLVYFNLKRDGKINIPLCFLAITIIMLLYYSGTIYFLLEISKPFFEGTAVVTKIEDFQQSIILGQTTGVIEGRENLYAKSWNGFWDNIIIGTGKLGGHSSIPDRLAAMGLLGTTPYLLIYINICKRWYSLMNSPYLRNFFLLGVLAAIVLLFFKGIFGNEGYMSLFIILPAFLLYLDKNHQNTQL